MRNLTLILGAGASYNYKAPLMKDFYKVATELYVNQSNDNLRDQYEVVFEFMDLLQKSQAKANLDLHNVEQVYTALEMAKMLNLKNLKVKGQNWQKMEEAMRYFLTKTIESKVSLPISDNFQRPPKNHSDMVFIGYSEKEALAQAIEHVVELKDEGWNISIITFNYDLVIEALFATHSIEVDYGLAAQTTVDNEKVPLLKLHGSINWERAAGEIKVQKYFEKGYRIQRSNPYFSVDDSHKVTTNFSEHLIPFVIPPVWNKSNYQNQLSNVWRKAAASLSETSHLYSLGYSLPQTDGFFKQLYALGTVGSAPLMELGVFDIEPPDIPNGVNKRYSALLGRGAENVYHYFDDGIKGLANKLNSLRR
tara:strand:+ start:1655 stop:2746 length:1092 start_codon:yes stop_codon:yes gene_type:complete